MTTSSEFDGAGGSHWSPRSILDALDWDHVRSEVAQENRGRVVIAGLHGAGKSTLLNRLEGWDVSPVSSAAPGAETWAGLEDLGLFALIDLPADERDADPAGLAGPRDLLGGAVGEADVVVFVVDGALLAAASGEAGAQARQSQMVEYRWLCRLRALGRPLVLVLSKADLLGDALAAAQADLERRLAAPLVAVSAQTDPGVALKLLPRVLEAEPDLLVPLAGEIPVLRQQAATRLIRQTALLSGVMGLEPVPLLDLPLQLALQARLLLRLASIYGQARPGGGSREMVAAAVGGLGMRYAVQQLAKLVPVLGWAVSGLLSGVITYLVGQAAAAHYQGLWAQQVQRLRQARVPAATIHAVTHGVAGAREGAAGLPKQIAAHLPRRHKADAPAQSGNGEAGDVLAELGLAPYEEAL